MLTIIYSQCIIFMALIFFMNNQPLVLGLLLMLMSIIYSMTLFMETNNTWLSYILIMVFVSGMMVMFMYMASMSSNEPMMFKKNYFFSMLILVLMSLFSLMNMFKKWNFNINNNNLKTTKTSNSLELIYKTYNLTLSEMTIMLVVYLLIVLLVAVKITATSKTINS